MLADVVLRSFSCFSIFLVCDYFIYLSHKHKRSYQRGIITKIKRSRGGDFSNAGLHHLSQQWVDLSESPFFIPPKNTLTHTIQSYFTHSVVSLNLDKPQGYKKGSSVFGFFPPLSLLLSFHPPLPSCKAVLTMYRPNNALMFLLFSLRAWAKYFLDNSRFSRPPWVYFTCEEALNTTNKLC